MSGGPRGTPLDLRAIESQFRGWIGSADPQKRAVAAVMFNTVAHCRALRAALEGIVSLSSASPTAIQAAIDAPFCTKHSHHEWSTEGPTELAVWRERAEAVVCNSCLDIRIRAAYTETSRFARERAAAVLAQARDD